MKQYRQWDIGSVYWENGADYVEVEHAHAELGHLLVSGDFVFRRRFNAGPPPFRQPRTLGSQSRLPLKVANSLNSGLGVPDEKERGDLIS